MSSRTEQQHSTTTSQPDRLVRLISASDHANDVDAILPFSAIYQRYPHIVLLGNPGSGKSETCKRSATCSGAVKPFKPGRLLSRPAASLVGLEALYIDGLDERRSRPGATSLTDELVSRLFDIQPKRTVIACRNQDWLGSTDLLMFADYYESTGDSFAVISLEPLTEPEKNSLLLESGINSPEEFLLRARQIGLERLTENPLNLIMLARVVLKSGWVESRKELYEKFTRQLATERNPDIARARYDDQSADEIIDVAGEVFAAMLLSGNEFVTTDIALLADINNNLPVLENGLELAATKRPLFVTENTSDVTYGHRTTAEYLAARWLAKQIERGYLNFQRVVSLLGSGDAPVAELKGVYAWLAVHSPTNAKQLIKADAYSVLTYGDATQLSPDNAALLLECIAQLSEESPWFHTSFSSTYLAGLATPANAGRIRQLLVSPITRWQLRRFLLHVMSQGSLLHSMVGDVVEILRSEKYCFAERSAALDVLLNYGGQHGEKAEEIVLGWGWHCSDAVRMARQLIEGRPNLHDDSSIIVKLITSEFQNSSEKFTGALWGFDEIIADQCTDDVLLGLCEIHVENDIEGNSSSDLVYIFDALLARRISDSRKPDPATLAKLLKRYLEVREVLGDWQENEVKTAFLSHPALTDSVAFELAKLVEISNYPQLSLRGVVDWLYSFRSPEQILQTLAPWFLDSALSLDKRKRILHDCFEFAYLCNPHAMYGYFDLLELITQQAEMGVDKNQYLFHKIPDWKADRLQRLRDRQRMEQQTYRKNSENFQLNLSKISAGLHKPWLRELARMFLRHRTSGGSVSQTDFLRLNTGEDDIRALENHVFAGVSIQPRPTVEQLASGETQGWWLIYPAALTLSFSRSSIEQIKFDDGIIEFCVINEMLKSSYRPLSKAEKTSRGKHPWLEYYIAQRPALVANAITRYCTTALALRKSVNDVLPYILHHDDLLPYRNEFIQFILSHTAQVDTYCTSQALAYCVNHQEFDIFLPFASKFIASKTLTAETRSSWLAAAFLASPEQYTEELRKESKRQTDIFWEIRDTINWAGRFKSKTNSFQILPSSALILVKIFAERFPYSSHPEGSWLGSRNSWDASEFISSLLKLIASTGGLEAIKLLTELDNDISGTYSDTVKHLIREATTLYREEQYCTPSWAEIRTSLKGGLPATAADLHALTCCHLESISQELKTTSVNKYQQFWNTDSHNRPIPNKPSREESARDTLIILLEAKFASMDAVRIEKELYAADSKRVDIAITLGRLKVVIEVKLQDHDKLWTAMADQLQQLYANDPETDGLGIYVVFWLGTNLPIKPHPLTGLKPDSPEVLTEQLEEQAKTLKPQKIAVQVFDVSLN